MSKDSSLLITGGALRSTLFRSRTGADAATRELPAGYRIGNYRILSVLARGGTSIVYAATRSDGAFCQRVALKVTHAHEALRERALRERDILARLDHPLIARIHDAGETDAGALWFAMELVDGEPIDRYLAGRAVRWNARLHLLRRIAEALADAHRGMVIHRDIKPANILVTREGTPRLVDFGIASEPDRRDEHATPMTLAYASPEQLRGDPVGFASDIYQLALLLDELLLDAGLQLPRSARRSLCAIVARATRLDPRERFQSVAEFGMELERVLAQRPAMCLRGAWLTRASLFVRRHARALVGFVALSTLAALLTARFAADAEAERRAAQIEAQTSQALGVLFSEMLADLPVDGQHEQRFAQALDRSRERLARRRDIAPEIRAALLQTLGSASVYAGDDGAAARALSASVALRRELGPNVRLALAGSLAKLAALQVRRGENAAAQELRAEAERILADASKRPSRARFEALLELAHATSNIERSGAILREAVAIGRTLFGAEAPELLQARRSEVANVRARWRMDEARGLLEVLVVDLEDRYGPDDDTVVYETIQLNRVRALNGDLDRAETYFRARLAERESWTGAWQDWRAHALEFDLGEVLRFRGDTAAAIELLQRSLDALALLESPQSPHSVNDAAYVAEVLFDAGATAHGCRLAQRVQAGLDALGDPLPAPHALPVLALAKTSGCALSDPMPRLEAARAHYVREFGEDGFYTAYLHTSLAELRLRVGDRSGARTLLEAARLAPAHGLRFQHARLVRRIDGALTALGTGAN
jgi:serine/threonine-protein kinase